MRTVTIAATLRLAPVLLAHEPESPWAARAFGEDVPPATLEEAREGRASLARLLGRERAAAADFLLALADFDRRRGWERLGHASLFAFLTRELGLSKGAAFLRLSAARLLPRHPQVEEALRRGDLCLSAVGELARVLDRENEAEVLPRFFGRSSREAREVAAAILPAPTPPTRAVVTRLAVPVRAVSSSAARSSVADGAGSSTPDCIEEADVPGAVAAYGRSPAEADPTASSIPSVDEVRAHEPHRDPPSVRPRPSTVEPLTAELRRLHLTVSKTFLEKVALAGSGMSHAQPGATTEQVLEAALDLLLERQAQRKGMGQRAMRKDRGEGARAVVTSTSTSNTAVRPPLREAESAEERRRSGPASPRPHTPAAIERAVRLRDDGRCQQPIDAGGICGSTWQVELDHRVPLALGGETTESNLRCLCRRHNVLAAREALGAAAHVVLARPRRRR